MRGVPVAEEGLVLGLRVEAGLVALTAPLADLVAGHSGHYSAHDGTDDCAGSACAVKAARGVEAASDDEAHQPDGAQREVGNEHAAACRYLPLRHYLQSEKSSKFSPICTNGGDIINVYL